MRILLAIDDSASSNPAIRAVSERPWPEATAVRVISVVPTPYALAPELVSTPELNRALQDLRREAEGSLQRVADTLSTAEQRLSVETVVRHGDPRAEIVQEAESWHADLVVLGSHGRTGLKRWLLGSVAEAVVRHAPCSVEVARDKEAR